MAKTFSLRGMLVPSQGRKTSSQGGGMPGGGAVAIGTPQESASTVINNVTNVVGGDYSKIVRITISDLLALDTTEVGENDLYIVYASGSDEDGWSGDPFEYDGETYLAKSFFQLINGEWQAITDEIDLSKSPKFGNLPEEVYLIEGLFPPTSFPNIYGRYKAGMQIAVVRRYHLDDAGVYQPVKESTGTPGGGTSVNDMWTINVPYARSYMEGGTMHYHGGVLSDEDYEIFKNLSSGGGGTIYTFQGGTNSFTVTPSNGQAQVVNVTPSITTDATPTAGSTNPVQSGGVEAALNEKSDTDHKHSAADITSGVLAPERGGTGQATLEQACNSLITALRTDTSQNNVPLDDDYFVSQFRGGTYDTYFRRPMSALWAYIKSKADLVYAAISHTHTTSDITGLAAVATSGAYADLSGLPNIRIGIRLAAGTDLNSVTNNGTYYASTLDNIVNAPAGVDRFGLAVMRTSTASSVVQILYSANGDRYERLADVFGVWSVWTKIVDDNIKYSSQSLTAAQQTQARNNIGASGKPDCVVFDQTGSVYNYTFSQIKVEGNITVRYDLMENSSSTPDMPICVEIDGLETAEDYKDYLRSHVVSVTLIGNEQSGLTQIDVFRSAYVFSIPSRKGINILLKTEVFEPNTRNRFVVNLKNI